MNNIYHKLRERIASLCENPDEPEQVSNSPAVQIITYSDFRARIDNMDDPQVGDEAVGGPGGGDAGDDGGGGEDGPIIQTVSEIGDIASIFDVIGNQLEAYAGITRLGSNGKLYFEKTPNNVFKGNQNTKTLALAKFGGKISAKATKIGRISTGILFLDDLGQKNYYKAGARVLYDVCTFGASVIPYVGPVLSGGLAILGVARGNKCLMRYNPLVKRTFININNNMMRIYNFLFAAIYLVGIRNKEKDCLWMSPWLTVTMFITFNVGTIVFLCERWFSFSFPLNKTTNYIMGGLVGLVLLFYYMKNKRYKQIVEKYRPFLSKQRRIVLFSIYFAYLLGATIPLLFAAFYRNHDWIFK